MPFTLPGGDLEYAVFAAVTALGGASVKDIHARVGEPAGLSYSTTSTVLDRLHAKGLLRRENRGRKVWYWPAAQRDDVDRRTVAGLLSRMLGDAPTPLMATLVLANLIGWLVAQAYLAVGGLAVGVAVAPLAVGGGVSLVAVGIAAAGSMLVSVPKGLVELLRTE